MLQYIIAMLRIGLFGFGGGSALIPVIEAEFRSQWNKEEKGDFDQSILIGSITPGAMPVNLAGSIGRYRYGRGGMILCALAMALPGSLLAYAMFTVLHEQGSSLILYVKAALLGITAFIYCCLLHYIQSVLAGCRDESTGRFWKAAMLVLAVAILSGEGTIRSLLSIESPAIFGVSTAYILLATFFVAAYGRGEYTPGRLAVIVPLCMIYFLGHGQRGILSDERIQIVVSGAMLILSIYGFWKSIGNTGAVFQVEIFELIKDLAAWTLFLGCLCIPAMFLSDHFFEFLERGVLSALISFGGGDAYLTIADGIFVDSGMVGFDTYYSEIIGVVNVLPGSILCKTLMGIGYYNGAAQGDAAANAMALAGFAISIAVSGSAFAIVRCFYSSLRESRAFRIVTRWIRPIVAGLLINVMMNLLKSCLLAAEVLGAPLIITVAVIGVMTVLNIVYSRKWKANGLLALIDVAVMFLLVFTGV